MSGMNRRQCLSLTAIGMAGIAGCTGSGVDNEPTSSEPTGSSESNRNGENFQERNDILNKYSDGIGEYNNGVDGRNQGSLSYNGGQYRQALTAFEEAEKHYSNAREDFRECISMSYNIDSGKATEIAEVAAEASLLNRDAVAAAQSAAEAGIDNNIDRANKKLDEFKELESEAEALNIRGTPAMQNTLDL